MLLPAPSTVEAIAEPSRTGIWPAPCNDDPRIPPPRIGWPLLCSAPNVAVVTAIVDCWLGPWPLTARLACSPRAAANVVASPIGVDGGAATRNGETVALGRLPPAWLRTNGIGVCSAA